MAWPCHSLLAVEGDAVGWCLGAVVHAVVADHAGDAQAVVSKVGFSSAGLCPTMSFELSPADDCLLVAPKRQRQDLAGLGQTFEAFDRNEPIDLLQQRFELGCEVEIGFSLIRMGFNLENDGDHVRLSSPGTASRKLRSSFKMKRCSAAKVKLVRPSSSAFNFVR